MRTSLAEKEAGHKEKNQSKTELTGTNWDLPLSLPFSNCDAAKGIRAFLVKCMCLARTLLLKKMQWELEVI